MLTLAFEVQHYDFPKLHFFRNFCEHFASQWAAYYQRGWGFDRDLDIKQDPIFHTAAADAAAVLLAAHQPLMT